MKTEEVKTNITADQSVDQHVKEITLGQAIRDALAEEMRRDPRVFIMGEDVADTPLDKETLIASAIKTSWAIVIDEGYESYGVTAEMAAVIADGAFYYLDAPVKRLGAMDVPVPFSPVLEDLTVPTATAVVEVAKTLCVHV